jgi:carbamoyl-phosphate synthase small subunit
MLQWSTLQEFSLPSFFSGHTQPAILALADGAVFKGFSIGACGHTTGEVVFNTSMTGYQEILTDPSYSHQIVTLTYPHIGNVGTNSEDVESSRVHAAGLIIRDLPLLASNFRSSQSLSDYLKSQNVVAIEGIDTRRLTRLLREKGAQNGAILTGSGDDPAIVARALDLARSFPGLSGMDLAKVVSTTQTYAWNQTQWALGQGYGLHGVADNVADNVADTASNNATNLPPSLHVVAYDFGVKYNILRMLASRGCKVTVVPAQTSANDVLALRPDGVFLSNGPGDPEPCDYAINATRELIERGIPLFGICLGHQIMALASGAKTLKMKFGHHGSNHPVQDLATGQVLITAQNHGFAVDADSLPANCKVTHRSLFDGSLQGFMRTDRAAFCFQGHPEASPGPGDIAGLFDRFIAMMENKKNA